MKNTSRILLLLLPALLASHLCHADPLNGGIRTEDVLGGLLLILAAVLVFVAAPVLSFLSYRRPGRQLNLTAWVLAIITKLACVIFLSRSADIFYLQWGAIANLLPNLSLYLLLLKAERNMMGWQFQLAILVRSILGILVVGSLFSMLLSRFISLGNIQVYGVISGIVRFGITVGFVYQYLKIAAAKGVNIASGLLHPFMCGLVITLGLYVSNIIMVLFVVAGSHGSLSGITNISFSMRYDTVFVVASALLSGVAAYGLFNLKRKNAG